MKHYYTTQEVGNMLGISLATVKNWIRSGSLVAFKTLGGHNRVRKDELIEFLNRNNIPLPPFLEVERHPKILIVEDDADVIKYIETIINELDYDVETETATDGFMTGSKLSTFKPDLVILDIMLPGMNGFEVCRQIRKEFNPDIKVLAVTGYDSMENRKRILDAGANVYIKKPIDYDEFRDVIEKLLLSGQNKFFITRRNGETERKNTEKERRLHVGK